MGVSEGQKKLGDFLVSLLGEGSVVREFRFSDSLQRVDFYIPSLKIAVDYDGLYWHSELQKQDNYHKDRRAKLLLSGVSYIRIFEDEWKNRTNCVKSLLASRLGRNSGLKPLRASSLLIKVVTSAEAKEFYSLHHIQGCGNLSGVSHGLLHEGELVACMTFSRRLSTRGSSNAGIVELSRFATSRSIYGAGSKLLKSLLAHSSAKSVVSYSDNRLFSGAMSAALGFDKKHLTPPSYTYFKSNLEVRLHKSNLRKSKLRVLLGSSYDDSKTERYLANSLGYYQVHDDGLTKWELRLT